jgi:hypothetical protein
VLKRATVAVPPAVPGVPVAPYTSPADGSVGADPPDDAVGAAKPL